MSNKTKPRVLIVDDEKAILKTLKEALTDEGYSVHVLSDGSKTLETIGKIIPDLVLLDIFMPHCNGLELLSSLHEEYPQQKVIMISGFGSIAIAVQALKKGALDFIEKPLSLDEILPKLEFLKEKECDTSRHMKENTSFSATKTYGAVGKSVAYTELIRQVGVIAPLPYPVLLYGELGTGKSLLAKIIHEQSSYKNGPLITIKCSHYTPDQQKEHLLQAFSLSDKEEKTLFIHHINKLSSENQTLLLSLLDQTEKNIRIIASSYESLFTAKEKGGFSPLLFFKLNVVPLEIPPLRKRPHDIPLLIDHFLKDANNSAGKHTSITTTLLRQLRNYNWPGNIQELCDTLHKLVALAPSSDHALTSTDFAQLGGTKNKQFVEEQSFLSFASLAQATESFEKSFLSYYLKQHYYDLGQVAHLLHMDTAKLKEKLAKLNIKGR